MEIKNLMEVINKIASSLPPKQPVYVLYSSPYLANIIKKEKDLCIDYENGYMKYKTPCYDINIHIDHLLKSFEAVLFKDSKIIVTIDELGNGKIYE